MSGCVVLAVTVGDVARAARRGFGVSSSVTCPSVVGGDDRRDVLDAQSLVGRVDEAAGAGRGGLQDSSAATPTCALPADCDDLSRAVTSAAASLFGVDLRPAAGGPAGPTSTTLATPGTPISRGRIVQRASTDISIRDIVVCASETDHEDPAGRRLRLEHDRRRAETLGSALAWVSRSLHHLPGAQQIGPRFEHQCRSTTARAPTPSACVVQPRHAVEQVRLQRNGDAAARPRRPTARAASVWTSTVVGENSGRTSRGRSGATTTATATAHSAVRRTIRRYRTAAPITLRIIAAPNRRSIRL